MPTFIEAVIDDLDQKGNLVIRELNTLNSLKLRPLIRFAQSDELLRSRIHDHLLLSGHLTLRGTAERNSPVHKRGPEQDGGLPVRKLDHLRFLRSLAWPGHQAIATRFRLRTPYYCHRWR